MWFPSFVTDVSFQLNNSVNNNVRFHVCEFIKLIVLAMANDGVIDDDVYDEIITIMKARSNVSEKKI